MIATNVFPTKGNLLSTKKSLALAKMGFELLIASGISWVGDDATH